MILSEKYRPRTILDVKGQDELRSEMLSIVNGDLEMQHYLFYSPEGGVGKTTIARALAKDLGYQLVEFNASSKKERGIEFVEEHIIPLTRSGSKERIFLLDEADQLTDAAQSALKGVIENASGYFILTCNRLPKVSRWLQSRCQVRTFNAISETDVFDALQNIALKETGFGIDEVILGKIYHLHGGDLRNSIGALQVYLAHRHKISEDSANQFISSLGISKINPKSFLRMCFLTKNHDDAVKMLRGDLRADIRTVFDEAMDTNAEVNSKMKVIEASIISERDILNGVDEEIVRHNYVRLLIGGQ